MGQWGRVGRMGHNFLALQIKELEGGKRQSESRPTAFSGSEMGDASRQGPWPPGPGSDIEIIINFMYNGGNLKGEACRCSCYRVLRPHNIPTNHSLCLR